MKIGPFDSLVEAQRIQVLLQEEGFDVDLAPGDNFMGLTSCSLFVHGIDDIEEIREIIENYSMGEEEPPQEDELIQTQSKTPSLSKDFLIYSGIAVCVYLLQAAPLALSPFSSSNFTQFGANPYYDNPSQLWLKDILYSCMILAGFSFFNIIFLRINPLKEIQIKIRDIFYVGLGLLALIFWDSYLLSIVAQNFYISATEYRTTLITQLGHLPYLGITMIYWMAIALLCQGIVFEVFQKRHGSAAAIIGATLFGLIAMFSFSTEYLYFGIYLLGLSCVRATSSSFSVFLALFSISLLLVEAI